MKENINISGFTGINNLNIKDVSEIVTGKNFRTFQGELTSRKGNRVLTEKIFDTSINSIHSCGISQITSRLLVQEGANLWLKNGTSAWELLSSTISNGQLNSTQWSTFREGRDSQLVLVNGTKNYVFNIEAGTSISEMANFSTISYDVPKMEKVTTHQGFVFGWSPNFSPANTLKFNDYITIDEDGEQKKYIDIDYWNPAFQIDPSNINETTLEFVSFDTHGLALTNRGAYRLEGYDENSFSTSVVGKYPVYGMNCASKVSNFIMWVGRDSNKLKVYAYGGSDIISIGEKIEEELNSRTFNKIFTIGHDGKFYIFMPNTTDTKVFIFDTIEKQWYIDIYEKIFTCACIHHENFLDKGYLYVGTSLGELVKFDNVSINDFLNTTYSTEFTYILELGRDNSKLKNIWITAEPKNDFTLNIVAQGDNNLETDVFSIDFTTGKQITKKVKIKRAKGSNMKVKFYTNDHIDKLIHLNFIVVPKSLK